MTRTLPHSAPIAGRDGEHTGSRVSRLGRSKVACSGLREYDIHRIFKDKITLSSPC